MKKEDLYKDSIMINSMMIYSIEELKRYPVVCVDLFDTINSIFEKLLKLKNGKFYNNKEIETVFMLIKQEISIINDTITALRLDATNIYEIILDIFQDLIHIYENNDNFEAAGNLLAVRDFWFNIHKIKIVK